MPNTISNVQGSQYALMSAGNPLTITSTGGVVVPSGASAIYGAASQAWTIVNAGIVSDDAVGGFGIDLLAGGTIVNSGTIGGGLDAIRFSGNAADLLVDDPGAVFTGLVVGGGSGSTLELAQTGGGGAGAGTLSGFATQFTGFGTLEVDANAVWTLASAGTLSSQTTLVDAGVLSTTGSLAEAGSMSIAGGQRSDVAVGSGGSLLNTGMLSLTGTLAVLGGEAAIINDEDPFDPTYEPYEGLGGVLINTGTLANGGSLLIAGASDAYSAMSGTGGTLLNSGSLLNVGLLDLLSSKSGAYGEFPLRGGLLLNSGVLTNAGTLLIAASVLFGNGSDALVSGTLRNTGTVDIAGGFAAGALTIAATGTLSGDGTVGAAGTLINQGTITSAVHLTETGLLTNAGAIAASVTVGTNGVVDNSGLISVGSLVSGVVLTDEGVVSNASTAALISGAEGVRVTVASSVTNVGTILGLTGAAVDFVYGGVVLNGSSGGSAGLIAGATRGITVAGRSGNVVNAGTITGVTQGIYLGVGGSVSNTGTIVSATSIGVSIHGGGTLTNAGTIAGAKYAVQLTGGAARLVDDPGAVFVGTVAASNGTLELASGNGGIGTLSGFGAQFTGFATLVVDSGAQWTLDNPGTLNGTTLSDNGMLVTEGSLGSVVGLTVAGGIDPPNVDLSAGVLLNTGSLGVSGLLTVGGGGRSNTDTQSGGSLLNSGTLFVAGSVAGAIAGEVELQAGAPGQFGYADNGLGGVLGNSGTVINAGTLQLDGGTGGGELDPGGAGGSLFNTGVLINHGLISLGGGGTGSSYGGGGGGGLLVDGGMLTNAGTLSLAGGGAPGSGQAAGKGAGIVISGTFDNTATIVVGKGQAGSYGPGTDATLTVDPGGSLFDAGTILGGVTLAGGTLELAAGHAAGLQAITFAGAATLRIDGAVQRVGTLFGLGAGDLIDLAGVSYVPGGSATITTGNTLQVLEGGATYDLALDPLQDFTGYSFVPVADAGTGTLIENTPCFCPGTLIRTPGGETPVEQLRIGDLVVTHAGGVAPVRWIGRRSYGGRFLAGKRHILPVRIKAGALADLVPRRDLVVSPLHAMFLDGALIPAGLLVNDVSVLQEEVREVHYLHIELAEHDVIWAEGAAAETFVDDDSRGMFENAHEYRALYPDASHSMARYCAPRLEDGYALEAVRRRIAARAGQPPQTPPLGLLRGFIDRVTASEVCGWAQDCAYPEAPVCLDVLVDGRVMAQVVAGRWRPDLQEAGLGSGHHSFAVPLDGLSGRDVEVRRSSDGTKLSSSPTLKT